MRGFSATHQRKETGEAWNTVREIRKSVWKEEQAKHSRKINHLVGRSRNCNKHKMCRDLDTLWIKRSGINEDKSFLVTCPPPPTPNQFPTIHHPPPLILPQNTPHNPMFSPTPPPLLPPPLPPFHVKMKTPHPPTPPPCHNSQPPTSTIPTSTTTPIHVKMKNPTPHPPPPTSVRLKTL